MTVGWSSLQQNFINILWYVKTIKFLVLSQFHNTFKIYLIDWLRYSIYIGSIKIEMQSYLRTVAIFLIHSTPLEAFSKMKINKISIERLLCKIDLRAAFKTMLNCQ